MDAQDFGNRRLVRQSPHSYRGTPGSSMTIGADHLLGSRHPARRTPRARELLLFLNGTAWQVRQAQGRGP